MIQFLMGQEEIRFEQIFLDGTKIEANAFKGSTNLTQIKLPKDCEIDPAAFDHPVYVFAPDLGTTRKCCDDQDNLIFAGKIAVK